jgi:hypothetical protein
MAKKKKRPRREAPKASQDAVSVVLQANFSRGSATTPPMRKGRPPKIGDHEWQAVSVHPNLSDGDRARLLRSPGRQLSRSAARRKRLASAKKTR